MRKIKKRFVPISMILVVFIAGLLLYFKPLKLSELTSQGQKILATQVEMGVKEGEAYINSENYNDITEEQKNNITSLFEEYSYKRTFGTVVSDGTLRGLGDQVVHIFVYDGNELVNTISISSTDSISVNSKTYRLKNSSELLDKLLEIIR